MTSLKEKLFGWDQGGPAVGGNEPTPDEGAESVSDPEPSNEPGSPQPSRVDAETQRYIGKLEQEVQALKATVEQMAAEPGESRDEADILDDPAVQTRLAQAVYGDQEIPEGANVAGAFKVIKNALRDELREEVSSLRQERENEKQVSQTREAIRRNVMTQLRQAVQDGVPYAREIAREFVQDTTSARLSQYVDQSALGSQTAIYNAVVRLSNDIQSEQGPPKQAGSRGSGPVARPRGTRRTRTSSKEQAIQEDEEYANAVREAIVGASGNRPDWL